jgi:hypothetical protein
MGGGTYSYDDRATRAVASGFDTKSAREIFTERSMNNAMSPNGISVRESRDSAEHPNSVPVVIALDVTGSMGSIPHFLVKEGLPDMMDKIIKDGVPDPQVLFLGIGDHECDNAPLQVGQFESSDELLDHWLTKLWIEGNGGGNMGESYHLAWLLAGRYTSTDHFEKRGKKGILFTIGDEPVLPDLPSHSQKMIMGDGQYSNTTKAELLDKAREQYEVFHLHLMQGSNGNSQRVKDGWKQLLGDNVLYIQRKEEVAQIIADKVLEVVSAQTGLVEPTQNTESETESAKTESVQPESEEEMML